MKRGEIWRYQPVVQRPGQSLLRLIVSADHINRDDGVPVILALHVVDTDPQSLLAPRVAEHGWARALSVEPVSRSRLVERVGAADPDAMEQVNAALRAAQDL